MTYETYRYYGNQNKIPLLVKAGVVLLVVAAVAAIAWVVLGYFFSTFDTLTGMLNPTALATYDSVKTYAALALVVSVTAGFIGAVSVFVGLVFPNYGQQ